MSHQLLRRFFIGLFVIIVLSMVAVVLLYVSGKSGTRLPSGPAQPEVVNNMHAGNFEAAIAAADAVVQDPNADSSMRARAQFSTFAAEFQVTGNVESFIKDVEKMKLIALDETVDIRTRVNALNMVGSAYYISGNNPEVFDAIYKSAPFSDYRVENNPDLSARKIYEWAYSVRKNPDSAIGISKWYSEQPIRNGIRMTEQQLAETIAKAEEYLKLAEAASLEAEKEDPEYLASARYLTYRYDRLRVIIRLATQIGEPYEGRYMEEVDRYVEFARASGVYQAPVTIRNIWFYQAAKLTRDGKTDAAKTVLAGLARDLATLEEPQKDAFVRFMYYELKLRPRGASALQINNMYGVSPEFKAAAEVAMSGLK